MLQLPESKFIINLLTHDLAPDRYYHTIDHTLDVYHSAQNIAVQEKITSHEFKLLSVAALYHDCGYLKSSIDHEIHSCETVREILPRFGYNILDIEKICTLIIATKLPQTPQSRIEQIICDADLDYLGRTDFFTIGNRLFREMLAYGRVKDEHQWHILQIEFLKNHRYFTATAQATRNQKKQENLNTLQVI